MRYTAPITAFLILLFGCLRTNTATAAESSRDMVYTVTAAQSGLAHNPALWLGRTVMLRGRLLGCPYALPGPCASWQPILVDPDSKKAPTFGLPVAFRWLHPTTVSSPSATSRIPQKLHWGEIAIYRVELKALAPSLCSTSRSYLGLLADAVP
jgi:hypothetical protein